MFKMIFFGLLLAGAAFAAYVAMQPSQFAVERSAVIAAPPAAVFSQVNDFHKWQEWSPWAKLDPNAKAVFDGKDQGEGASFAWQGNREVGSGKMTITESKPDERITMKLDFTAPMTASNITVFTFKPEGQGTRMTWTMSGENNFVGRAICMFMDMDKMVGTKFEEGMKNINALLSKKT